MPDARGNDRLDVVGAGGEYHRVRQSPGVIRLVVAVVIPHGRGGRHTVAEDLTKLVEQDGRERWRIRHRGAKF
jgi:hypothetical protein